MVRGVCEEELRSLARSPVLALKTPLREPAKIFRHDSDVAVSLGQHQNPECAVLVVPTNESEEALSKSGAGRPIGIPGLAAFRVLDDGDLVQSAHLHWGFV